MFFYLAPEARCISSLFHLLFLWTSTSNNSRITPTSFYFITILLQFKSSQDAITIHYKWYSSTLMILILNFIFQIHFFFAKKKKVIMLKF